MKNEIRRRMQTPGDVSDYFVNICTVDARKLIEYTNTLARHLTRSEFYEILNVYRDVLDRLEVEGVVFDDER